MSKGTSVLHGLTKHRTKGPTRLSLPERNLLFQIHPRTQRLKLHRFRKCQEFKKCWMYTSILHNKSKHDDMKYNTKPSTKQGKQVFKHTATAQTAFNNTRIIHGRGNISSWVSFRGEGVANDCVLCLRLRRLQFGGEQLYKLTDRKVTYQLTSDKHFSPPQPVKC